MTDLERLQGQWRQVKFEENGLVDPPDILAISAAIAMLIAFRAWPAEDPEVIEHTHADLPSNHPHLDKIGDARSHAHPFVVDDLHPTWPARN